MTKTIRIAICDDEQDTRQRLAEMITLICPEQAQPAIDMFSSGRMLMDAFDAADPFDCVFLDILMDDVDGIQIAKMLRDTGYTNLIIFISNTAFYALKGYEVSAYGYYLKPITKETLTAILDAILEKCSNTRLLVSTKACLHSVVTGTILYIESIGRMASIVTESELIQAYTTLYRLEAQLDPRYFVRCHKGYIVNLQKIAKISAQSIRLCSDHEIPLGRNYKCHVHECFLAFLRVR